MTLDNGVITEGIAPLFLSASRSTDIPALYSKWFVNRLKSGYLRWINPFNNKQSIISLEGVKLIVFWSKNPQPMIGYLDELEKRDIKYFFHYTLNDYEEDGFEPGIPSLDKRIETFKKLSSIIGKDRVLWRFDPLILTDKINADMLLEKIRRIGDQIAPFTCRLTISFLVHYEKVKKNMNNKSINVFDFTEETVSIIGKGLQDMSCRWGIPVYTCAEPRSLEKYGIYHGACIDSSHICKTFQKDTQIMSFFGEHNLQTDLLKQEHDAIYDLKDPGQREHCRCIVSKDIGRYDTCTHFCVYCYANRSERQVKNNLKNLSETNDNLIGWY